MNDENINKERDEYALQARKTRFLLVAAICTISFTVLIILFSPYFNISDVYISGNLRISQEEILNRLEIQEGSHLLLFNSRAARRRILENFYISDVEFERILPGRLRVTVTERRLTAYIEHTGSYLYLDDNGRVIDVRDYISDTLPLLDGLRFNSFQLGEILDVPDPAAFSVIVQYAQLLNQHNLIGRVSHINVSDSANIRIHAERIEFNVGDISDAVEKIMTIDEILNNLPNVGLIPGFVDLRERNTEYLFKLLQ